MSKEFDQAMLIHNKALRAAEIANDLIDALEELATLEEEGTNTLIRNRLYGTYISKVKDISEYLDEVNNLWAGEATLHGELPADF